jgi:hypothetical protein
VTVWRQRGSRTLAQAMLPVLLTLSFRVWPRTPPLPLLSTHTSPGKKYVVPVEGSVISTCTACEVRALLSSQYFLRL